MKKISLLVITTILITRLYAQHRIAVDICKGTESKKLFDTSWVLVVYYQNDTFTLRTIKHVINNIEYLQKPYFDFKNSEKIYEPRYYREDSTGSIYTYDTLNNEEILLIPSDESMKGKEFFSKWFDIFKSFSVIDYHAKLSTPYCNYTDLIKLGEKTMNHPLDYRKFSYYKRGIGLVAGTLDDDVYIFLEAMYIEK